MSKTWSLRIANPKPSSNTDEVASYIMKYGATTISTFAWLKTSSWSL